MKEPLDKLGDEETVRFSWNLAALLGRWVFTASILLALVWAVMALKPVPNIPVGIQVACLALFFLTVLFGSRMLNERRRNLAAMSRFRNAFLGIEPGTRTDGLAPDQFDQLQRRCSNLGGEPGRWWRLLEDQLEHYVNRQGHDGWYVTRSIEEVLPESEVIDPTYHGSFHQSVPGILTALGLLATFTAILIALAGVQYQAGNAGSPVRGIDGLINGLSGKFLSSIIALILSVLFTLVEKKLCERQLRNSYASLVQTCRRTLPHLSELRVMADLQNALRKMADTEARRMRA